MAGVKRHRWDHALGFAKKIEKRDLASFVVTLYACKIQGFLGLCRGQGEIRVKKRPVVPIEVSFRTFVAITFAGSIFFHVIGLGIHSYLNGQKRALIGRIESLAEAESQVSEIDASLAAFHEELLQGITEGHSQGKESRRLLIQARLIRILIQNLDRLDARNHSILPSGWIPIEKSEISCLKNPAVQGRMCVQRLLSQVGDFQHRVTLSRRDEVRRLSLVERRQMHLEHLDTWLYWGTTVLGLLFMAMGWRNVVLQVGEPIKDVAGYLQTFEESKPKKSHPLIPPLFSISELAILLKNMSRIYRDPLTGALVRRAIIKILAREIVRSKEEGFALAVGIFDIDGLQRFNHEHGHRAGDEILCQVASRIQESLGEGEYFGRIGGEEFLVVSPRINAEDLLIHYDQLRQSVANPTRLESGDLVPVTVSVGSAILEAGQSEDDLLRVAESSLLREKRGSP